MEKFLGRDSNSGFFAVLTGLLAPKGAAAGTNDEIARAVRDSADGITADAVAKQVGVSRVTAWRYLERLADEGTVTRQTDYGKAGRPKIRYLWR